MAFKNHIDLLLKNCSDVIVNLEKVSEIDETYRNGIMNKLVFSGVPLNGILSQTINCQNFVIKFTLEEMKI
ncbi:hypothetical protein WPG_1751 [Winogradskyella sp. PG-2]|nr:hypothetical protein WPG_1751 [Winogradskyella sp. PG-2]